MVVGTKAGELLEICEKTGEVRELGLGHGEGELWGLATHPSADKFISASDDGTVRMWDIGSKVSGARNWPPGEADGRRRGEGRCGNED